MTKKLSPQKMSKMMTLYFQGWSQTEIANKLGVDQSTVSLYAGKLKALAMEKGMNTAAEEYGIMDTVEALHSLGAELKKNNSTVEEAMLGLKMELFFQKLGIKQEQYGQLINACKKMKEEGFIVAAIKLAHLEDSTGTTYEQLLAHYGAVQKNLAGATGELQAATDKLATLKKEVATFEKQKMAAGEQLQSYMKQVGVDTQRIKLVENLAKALKDGGIPDTDIEIYKQRQQALNKAGFDMGLFMAILDKMKVITALDHGKGLLKSLSEYGSLMEVCSGLQAEAKALKGQVAGLEQQAALKGKIEVEISKLKAEKAGLEPYVADLNTQYQHLFILQSNIAVLEPQKKTLAQKIGELETRAAELTADIEVKEKKVVDLKEVESKHAALLKESAELEVKVKDDQRRWDTYQAFLGLVLKGSIAEMEKFSEALPSVLEKVKKGEYQPGKMKSHILQKLAGPELKVFKCMMCQETFRVSNPAPSGGYYCPKCGFTHAVEIDKDAAAIFEEMLSPETPKPTGTARPFPYVIQPENPDGKV